MISDVLQRRYPTTVFAVRLEEPVSGVEDIRGVDVIWVEGPARDRVEDQLDHFQGISWNPSSGEFQDRDHFAVTEDGQLIRVLYNVDYIFCDGPALEEPSF